MFLQYRGVRVAGCCPALSHQQLYRLCTTACDEAPGDGKRLLTHEPLLLLLLLLLLPLLLGFVGLRLNK
jgi:hypothetical protein